MPSPGGAPHARAIRDGRTRVSSCLGVPFVAAWHLCRCEVRCSHWEGKSLRRDPRTYTLLRDRGGRGGEGHDE